MKRLVKNGEPILDGTEPLYMVEEKIFNKLEQIEDWEEENGVECAKLFEAFEHDIWIKWEDEIMFIPYDHKSFNFVEGVINCYPEPKPWGYTVPIEGYGTTWALTKEELL